MNNGANITRLIASSSLVMNVRTCLIGAQATNFSILRCPLLKLSSGGVTSRARLSCGLQDQYETQ